MALARSLSLTVDAGDGSGAEDGGGGGGSGVVAASASSDSLAAIVSASSRTESRADSDKSKIGGMRAIERGSGVATPASSRLFSKGDNPLMWSAAASARRQAVSGVRGTIGGGLISAKPSWCC